MLRRACALLVATVVFMPLFASAAVAYEPGNGPVFNAPRPKGSPAVFRIANHVAAAVSHVPAYDPLFPRPEIRIATYSHDLKNVTDALIAAHRRGVSVQMVLNDNWTSGQTGRLVRRLGTDRSQRSWVHVCNGACRGAGTRTNQHAKMYLFSQSGTAKNIVMTGSANTTVYAAKVHWNDLFTAQNVPNLYDVYHKVFEQMAKDDGSPNGYLTYSADGYDGYFFPKYGFSQADDPVIDRLNAVDCNAPGGGINGKTAIRIDMYAWSGARGLWIAQKMAQLKRRGCNIRAIVSFQGHYVLKELKAAGIPVRSGNMNLDGNTTNGWGGSGYEIFSHEKWMALSGKYKGSLGKHVWTGSDNWSDISNNNDEATIHIDKAVYYGRYMDAFNLVWSRWSRRL
jgi:phosphatidylserine/phosphatidylglycerophosphate/cardiolipin synthase-like enzyme